MFGTFWSLATVSFCILATTVASNMTPTREYNVSSKSSNRSDAVAYVKLLADFGTFWSPMSLFSECCLELDLCGRSLRPPDFVGGWVLILSYSNAPLEEATSVNLRIQLIHELKFEEVM